MFLLHGAFPSLDYDELTIFCLLATVIPLWLYDFIFARVYNRPSTNLSAQRSKPDRRRVVIKLIGLYATFALILFCYYLIPMYRAPFYKPYFYLIGTLLFIAIPVGAIYFWEMDGRLKNPYDEYWRLGCFLTGRFKEAKPSILAEHARAWFIKAFFSPIMFAVLVEYVQFLSTFQWKNISFLDTFNYLLTFTYTLDVLYATLGFVLTLRIFDTHIRSTDTTILGWIVCLACYYPFNNWFGIGLFNYEDNVSWIGWLGQYPFFYYACGSLIILLNLVYGLASVALGYRWSNLAYRGIITSGPYRFSKHPAYITKMAYWWLISLPFLSMEGPLIAFQHTLALIAISLIYYLRAKTEENHLSNYPEYVQYANWMNEHGIFSFVGKIFPALRYSEEKAKCWGSAVWWKKV